MCGRNDVGTCIDHQPTRNNLDAALVKVSDLAHQDQWINHGSRAKNAHHIFVENP